MTVLLAFAIFILLFLVLVYIARASELTAVLNGEDKDTTNLSRRNGYFMIAFLVLFMAAIAWSVKKFVPVMIPKAASLHGVETDSLFYWTLGFISIVFVLTHVALFWFSYRYNEANNKEAYFYSHNNTLEVIWTAIPAVVMAGLVVFGMRVWFKIFDVNARDTKNMMVIEATAKQFLWQVRYPGKDAKFGERLIDKQHVTPENDLGVNWEDERSHDDFFAKEIVLVKNRPVLVKLGALDVLHSFYLPHFRVKMDCVPGLPTQFYFTPTMTTKEMQQYLSTQPWWQETNKETGRPRWETFKYELACTELCGRSHYAMQKDVIVVDEAEYTTWLNSQASYYETVVKPSLASSTPAAPETTNDKLSPADSAQVAIDKPVSLLTKSK
jgi:cytochrome c oxidase subunit 2